MHLFICNRGCEVYYNDKTCENVNLDVDDTTGSGPETMTLASQMPAPLDQTYVLWVCIFHVLLGKIQVLLKSFVDSFYMQKWYSITKIVPTYCEKKLFW